MNTTKGCTDKQCFIGPGRNLAFRWYLAALMGHSKINMVLRYVHSSQEHQARSAGRLMQFNVARQMEALLPEQGAAAGIIQ